MTYAKIEDGQIVEYPVYEGDIRLRFSNVSFPTPFVAPEGYTRVLDAIPPEISPLHNLVEGVPVQIDGQWTRQWFITDATKDQIADRTAACWVAIRADRNRRLAACDWTQLADAPVDATVWATYRQELRDITTQADPFNVVWPTAPDAQTPIAK